MDGDVVPHGELDVATVEHRQHLVLLLVRLVGAWQVDAAMPLLKDGRAVRSFDRHLALEHPGPLPVRGRWLDAFVDQEEGDAPVVGAAANQPLDLGVGKRLVGNDGSDRPCLEGNLVGDAAAGLALPDPLGCLGLGIDQELAGSLIVVPPAGADLQGGGFERDAEGKPQRRRVDRLGHGSRQFRGTVVAVQVAPTDPLDPEFLTRWEVAFEIVVVLVGRGGGLLEQGRGHVLSPLAGGEDADEVAVPDAFGDLFLVALGWSLEFLDRHLLQHVTQHEGRGNRLFESHLSHDRLSLSRSNVQPKRESRIIRCLRRNPTQSPRLLSTRKEIPHPASGRWSRQHPAIRPCRRLRRPSSGKSSR